MRCVIRTRSFLLTWKNSTRLQDKLAAASAKLAEDKFADAIEKVSDFRATVEVLNTAPKLKIHPDDAAVLIGGANDVIACPRKRSHAVSATDGRDSFPHQ